LKIVCVLYFALDLRWLLVTIEGTEKEVEEVSDITFKPSYQVNSGVTGGGGVLIAAREKENRKRQLGRARDFQSSHQATERVVEGGEITALT